MKGLRRFWFRLKGVLTTRRRDAMLQHEFEQHIEFLTEENERAGMRPEEARRLAILKFGPVESLKEDYRDQRSLPFVDTLIQDLRYAWRTLSRDSTFTVTTVAILAVGIGANTAVFSVLQALVLRPLPFYAADRLVWIENEYPTSKTEGLSGKSSRVAMLWEWQRRSRCFEQTEAYNAFFGRGSYSLADGGEPERLVGVEVTRNLFSMLGVQPKLGRSFLEDDSRQNGPKVALISHGLWERRFASDPRTVGRSVRLNDQPATIVGVMPKDFEFGGVFAPGVRADIFLPVVLEDIQDWGHTLAVVGRLRPGMSVDQAQAEIAVLNSQILTEHPDWRAYTGARLSYLQDAVTGRMRTAVLLLTAAVAMVLLIVCVNVANLLLARGTSRRKEIAVRAALGASRSRIVRQMLTESLVLSVLASPLALALAHFATFKLAGLQGLDIPLLHMVEIDGAALAYNTGTTFLTLLFFGLFPSIAASKTNLQAGMNEAGRGSSEGSRTSWVRNALVVSEVALACILLAGCGLLIRSFLHVLNVDMGFRPERVVSLRVDPTSKYQTREQRSVFIDELARRVAALPGVEASSVTDALPLDRNRSWDVGAKGQIYPNGRPPAFVRYVYPGYFQTLGISMRAGHDLSEHDKRGASDVIIFNETGARALWPHLEFNDVIGQTAILFANTPFRVIGIVRDVLHSGPEHAAGAEMYLALKQGGSQSVDLVMRTSTDPAALASSIRATLRPVDPDLPVEVKFLETLIDRSVSPRRFVVMILGVFALLAITLASLGLYGVVSYSVTRRTQEIGVRMALGATARDVKLQILRSTLALSLFGVAAGLAGAILLTKWIEALLYGVSPYDPLTFAITPLILVCVALLAGYLPARHASRIDPMTALRVG